MWNVHKKHDSKTWVVEWVELKRHICCLSVNKHDSNSYPFRALWFYKINYRNPDCPPTLTHNKYPGYMWQSCDPLYIYLGAQDILCLLSTAHSTKKDLFMLLHVHTDRVHCTHLGYSIQEGPIINVLTWGQEIPLELHPLNSLYIRVILTVTTCV